MLVSPRMSAVISNAKVNQTSNLTGPNPKTKKLTLTLLSLTLKLINPKANPKTLTLPVRYRKINHPFLRVFNTRNTVATKTITVSYLYVTI